MFRNVNGNSALHFASTGIHPKSKLIKLLISAGAQIDIQNQRGETPLHNAAVRTASLKAFYNVTKELLLNKANANSKDNDGNTPLHRVCNTPLVFQSKNHILVAELLIKYGADINAKNNAGKTPLQMCENESLINFLISNGAM